MEMLGDANAKKTMKKAAKKGGLTKKQKTCPRLCSLKS